LAKSLNSTELIDSIKRRAFIPTTQDTFSTDDFLKIATEEMGSCLVPKIKELHEDFYLTFKDVDLVADTSTYDIPYRASGNKLRDISWVDNDGMVCKLDRIGVEEVPFYQSGGSNAPRYYYVVDNKITFVPDIGSTVVGSVRFHHYLSHNTLVQTTRAATITAIDTTTGAVTVSSVPSNLAANTEMDFIANNTPHKILGYDLIPTDVNSSTKIITFSASDLPSSLAVGDFITTAQETIYPQAPTELHPLLAQYTAIACLESTNDSEGLKNALLKLKKMEDGLKVTMDNRVEGSPQKVVNHRSFFRQAVARKRF
jgi:hypothetical protein